MKYNCQLVDQLHLPYKLHDRSMRGKLFYKCCQLWAVKRDVIKVYTGMSIDFLSRNVLILLVRWKNENDETNFVIKFQILDNKFLTASTSNRISQRRHRCVSIVNDTDFVTLVLRRVGDCTNHQTVFTRIRKKARSKVVFFFH